MMRPLIEVQNLTKHFVIQRSWNGQPLKTVQAVTQVTFSIPSGETLGLVGETGCAQPSRQMDQYLPTHILDQMVTYDI